jgi:maleate cis-trans isomerase
VAVSGHRIGVLAPLREQPGEYNDVAAAAAGQVSLWQVITEAPDDHSLDSLLAAGEESRLLAGVERMERWRPDVVVWACTSGAFVRGRAGALAQIEAIERAAGVPATSAALAFVEAATALGVDEVAIVAPYPEAAARAFADFLAEWGIAVRQTVTLGCDGPSVSERLTAADLEPELAALDPDVAVLLPDTAVWGIEILAELGPRRAAPLLVANQVTLWHAFTLIGLDTALPAFGGLAGIDAPGTTRTPTLLGRER